MASKRPCPLERRWQEPHTPMSVRLFCDRSSMRDGPVASDAPPWLDTGSQERAFDFTAHVECLLRDICARCPEFHHVDVSRVLLAAFLARNRSRHGVQAQVTPLRFRHGQLIHVRRGVPFQVQRYFSGSVEFLYVMSFCLPRFLNQDFDGKLITLFHELYHISPEFNGDLRRHPGRYKIHTHSRCRYNDQMAHFARAYLSGKPERRLLDFLRLDFPQLQRRHGAVAAVVVPRPKIVPLSTTMLPAASDR